LPFLSFGGSSLVITLFSAGVLLNVSRGAAEPARRPTLEGLPPRAWRCAS